MGKTTDIFKSVLSTNKEIKSKFDKTNNNNKEVDYNQIGVL